MAIQWNDITLDQKVPAGDFRPLWVLVLEAVADWKHLRIHAEGEWTFLQGGTYSYGCGPDGAVGLSLAPEAVLVEDCPPGCLLGRFGGSSAGRHRVAAGGAADAAEGAGGGSGAGEIFAIGQDCLYKVPAGTFGPLFVGLNLATRPVHITRLNLTIKGANL